MTIGEKIRILKIENKMSSTQFAIKCGVTPATVSNWTTGKSIPNDERIKRIASVFGISVEEFLNYKNTNDIAKRIEFMFKRTKNKHGKPISQEEVGRRIFVSRSTFGSWLNGRIKPAPESISQLALVFGCSKEWLETGAGEQPEGYEAAVKDVEEVKQEPKTEVIERPAEQERIDYDEMFEQMLLVFGYEKTAAWLSMQMWNTRYKTAHGKYSEIKFDWYMDKLTEMKRKD